MGSICAYTNDEKTTEVVPEVRKECVSAEPEIKVYSINSSRITMQISLIMKRKIMKIKISM